MRERWKVTSCDESSLVGSSEKRREVKMVRERNPGMDGKRCNRKS